MSNTKTDYKEITFYAINNVNECSLFSQAQYDKRYDHYTSHIVIKLPLGEISSLKDQLFPEHKRMNELIENEFRYRKEISQIKEENEKLKNQLESAKDE